MKHNLKITFLLLAMFLITQFIGLYVINFYLNSGTQLPYGMQPPEDMSTTSSTSSIIVAFIIAIVLLILLMKFKAEFILKLWFFSVVSIAIAIFFNAILPRTSYTSIVALVIAIPLAAIKIYGRNFFTHNLTELIIYPGIASVFVPMLSLWAIIILLILISVYDMWAVWHSGIMQKMARYQIDKLNIFSGFFVPYMSKKVKIQIEKIKAMSVSKSKKEKMAKKLGKKIKVNVAILGGGDVVFPIITAGVLMKTVGLIPALFVIAGAALGLTYLFFFAEKKKFYPAMPFITTGIFLGLLLYWIMFVLL